MSEKESRPGRALGWWAALQPDAPGGGDRAALARLRRCATVAEVMQDPVTIELFRRLGFRDPAHLTRAALVAAVLAHVREAAPGAPFARAIGLQGGDTPATVSPLRFRRLLQAQTEDEQLIAFRRAVSLAGSKANVFDLAAGLLAWNHPEHGERTRRRWIFDYWNAADAAQPVA